MRIKPYLQLVRLPNLFTAAADGLAGWLLVRGTFDEPGRWLCLAGASAALYAGGVTLNDVCDFSVDVRERPGRPLPSGRVPFRVAAVLAAVLFAAGLGLAAASQTPHGLALAAGIIAAVVAYDAWLKSTGMGPQAMGLCRSLNLLLGLSVASDLGGPTGWVSAASYGLFVCGITWISRHEADAARRFDPTVAAGLALQNVALVGQAAAWLFAPVRAGAVGPGMGPAVLGAVVLGGVAVRVNRAGLSALRSPSPATLQGAVKSGIFSLVWFHVALLLAVQGPGPAAAVAALWFPAFLVGRWVYST